MSTYVARPKLKYGESPFLSEGIDMEVQPRTYARAQVGTFIDSETGEECLARHQFMRPVDKDEFLKIYAEGVKALFNLPASAVKVLTVMLESYRGTRNIKRGKYTEDMVYITYRSAVADHGYDRTEATYIAGLNHLIVQSIIAPHLDHGWFFVNPNLFFKGNRYDFVRSYYLEKSEKRLSFRESEQLSSTTPPASSVD